jgi:hypothetical protein
MHATALCYVVDPIGRALFGQWSALLKGKFSRFVCPGRRPEDKSVGERWHFLVARKHIFSDWFYCVKSQFNMEDRRNAVWSFTGGE